MRRYPTPLMTLVAVAMATVATAAMGQSKDEQTIRALSEKWQRDIAAQNVDAIVSLFAPDGIIMAGNTPLMAGSDVIRNAYSMMVKAPGLSVHWTPTKIDVASPRLATEYGTYTESFDTPNGKVNDAGNYVTIWHKINGVWHVALDAPVSATPLPTNTAAPDAADTQITGTTTLAWSDLNVPGFDPGAKIAVLHGNPAAKGDYTLRLQFPDGYRFPVHWHPNGEHLTVVSGTFLLGMGNTADWSALKSYSPGDFLYLPGRHAHFGGAQGVTVVQLHGDGPFAINLGAPK